MAKITGHLAAEFAEYAEKWINSRPIVNPEGAKEVEYVQYIEFANFEENWRVTMLIDKWCSPKGVLQIVKELEDKHPQLVAYFIGTTQSKKVVV